MALLLGNCTTFVKFHDGGRRSGVLRCTFNEASLLVVVSVEVEWIGHVFDGEIP